MVIRISPLHRTLDLVHLSWLTRIALGYLALVSLQIGVWAVAAPRSFYDDFPGLGRSWVAADGPYNEHLVRDVGALNLAFAVLVIAAAIRLTRTLVTTTSIAGLVWGVPHLLYHLVNSGELSVGDAAASIGGLVAFVALPVALLVFVRPTLGDGPEPAQR